MIVDVLVNNELTAYGPFETRTVSKWQPCALHFSMPYCTRDRLRRREVKETLVGVLKLTVSTMIVPKLQYSETVIDKGGFFRSKSKTVLIISHRLICRTIQLVDVQPGVIGAVSSCLLNKDHSSSHCPLFELCFPPLSARPYTSASTPSASRARLPKTPMSILQRNASV